MFGGHGVIDCSNGNKVLQKYDWAEEVFSNL